VFGNSASFEIPKIFVAHAAMRPANSAVALAIHLTQRGLSIQAVPKAKEVRVFMDEVGLANQ
jgi:hypothetical protein